MLAREAAVQWLRGHSDALAHALHRKSFAVSQETARDDTTETSHPET